MRVGDHIRVDPDEPATDGRLVSVRDPPVRRGHRREPPRRTRRASHLARAHLLALNGRCSERTVDASNEVDIRGVVAFVGNTV